METTNPVQNDYHQIAFYPTYEEWKLFFELHKILCCQSFYPTYEEWKLGKNNREIFKAMNFLSYL